MALPLPPASLGADEILATMPECVPLVQRVRSALPRLAQYYGALPMYADTDTMVAAGAGPDLLALGGSSSVV
eukprot:2306085-Lingulodinium_polyedra.AAC.1